MRNRPRELKRGTSDDIGSGNPAPPSRSSRRLGRSVLLLSVLGLVVLLSSVALRYGDVRERAGEFLYREPGETVFPLPARYTGSFTNDWGAARSQGSHEGTDIFAPEGTVVRSVTSGTVTTAYGSDGDGWNTLGGYTVMVVADRDSGPVERGDRLYYAHLSRPSGLEDGEYVEAGDEIGRVGRTAGEEPGTVADFPSHLHLGWYGGFGSVFGSEQERDTSRSGAINPYPLLRDVQSD